MVSVNAEGLRIIEKVAEYLILAANLRADAPREDYVRANRLSFELAMILPASIYRFVVRSIREGTPDCNIMRAAVMVRCWLHGGADDGLSGNDDLAFHSPGIGKK